MKRKGLLLGLLSLAFVGATVFGFAGCDFGDKGETAEKSEMEKVYAQYVVYAEAKGETPLSYEEWLASIKGEDGKDGKSAYEIWLGKGYTGTQLDFLNWLKGEQGPQGEKGDKGDQGEKGDKGDQGEDGKSAYEIWLANGNTGTEEDFLAWLKGSNGHNFGAWQVFTDGDISCEQRIFYRICSDCSVIEWKKGTPNDHNWDTVTTAPTCQAQGYDTNTCTICGETVVENYTNKAGHAWRTGYSYDNSYHWYACGTCTETKNKAEHTPDDTGECTVCHALVGATEGVVYDLSADGSYAEVIGYEGTAKRVRIADTYKGVPVRSIYDNAFNNKKSIVSVIIPDSVTSIGNYAFYSCNSLTSVVIPDSVTSIGNYAFARCSRLTSVVIGDSVTSIGEYAFGDCSSLTSVVIPDSVTSIGDRAFKDCTSLTSVVIPDSVTSIGYEAFADCDKLIFNEYGNCKYLGSADNPYYALIGGANANYSNYTIHEDTKVIADYAFYNCDRMASILILDSVTSIGNKAFSSCDSLTSVVIPDSVTSIGNYAFEYCDSLTSVVIGDSVTSIGYSAFSSCNSLTSVYYTGTIDGWAQVSFGNFFANPLYYAKNLYINNQLVTEVTLTTATKISAYAFYNCTSLTSVVIGNSVTSIGYYAFYSCDSLTSVVIGNSVTSIGYYAFARCSRLTSVVIGNSVTSIGYDAFSSCDSLTSVYYKGTANDWSGISIGSSNYKLTGATRYYYSESQPTVSGNYWHYNDNGEIVIW